MKASIFEYSSARDYLKDVVDREIHRGSSFRQLAKDWQMASPNYIQKILHGERNLTLANATKITRRQKMSRKESDYFLELVRLDSPKYANKEPILARMRALIAGGSQPRLSDDSIYSSWLHGVVYELAAIKGLTLDTATIKSLLKVPASEQDIEASIKFLIGKGRLRRAQGPEGDRWERKEIHFQPLDNKRRIDLQSNHLRFIDFSRFRINDGLDDREYRGLTVAVSQRQFNNTKEKIREFYAKLREDLSESTDEKTILMRLQLTMYKLLEMQFDLNSNPDQ